MLWIWNVWQTFKIETGQASEGIGEDRRQVEASWWGLGPRKIGYHQSEVAPSSQSELPNSLQSLQHRNEKTQSGRLTQALGSAAWREWEDKGQGLASNSESRWWDEQTVPARRERRKRKEGKEWIAWEKWINWRNWRFYQVWIWKVH